MTKTETGKIAQGRDHDIQAKIIAAYLPVYAAAEKTGALAGRLRLRNRLYNLSAVFALASVVMPFVALPVGVVAGLALVSLPLLGGMVGAYQLAAHLGKKIEAQSAAAARIKIQADIDSGKLLRRYLEETAASRGLQLCAPEFGARAQKASAVSPPPPPASWCNKTRGSSRR